ncbi:TonB-dependent receptor [Gammaproteobacteria bacterium]|nr:TonB-dependent receptor [Gammaproteobacteria bacterium]MDB4164918.1 TonB-dependent receptor [Gammaproteobacteria bacterium]MDC1422042.1 TonB-dependent receptor [Gammaproteobacteria bacterium]MDC1511037.1 TonB-dependent receptor [Gammaproteobacteria bacterium]HAU09008.1 TonB-dependent receptor [Gammaproteobacteria bacterium]
MTTHNLTLRLITAALGAPFLLAGNAHGQNAPTEQNVEEIVVIGVVPGGAGIDRNKIPYPVQTADAAAIQQADSASLADFLRRGFGSVTLNDAQNNPLQPDLQYRGFTASPLLGLAQGLSVYQNGARINEPLGDSVNWDLMPQSAIAGVTLTGGTNPLFGLNSLGGSLGIRMKNGFEFEGSQLGVRTGSFGRTTAFLETGGNNYDGTEGFAYYLNVESFDEDGWRDQSASEALNAYASVGWRGERGSINADLQRGDSNLRGNGAAPVELLALNRAAIFTAPDITENDLLMAALDFAFELTPTQTLSGNLYNRRNTTDAFNGDGSEFGVCNFGGRPTLIEALEDDDLEEIGLDDDDLCDNQFASADALEDYLNTLGSDDEFNLEDFTDDLSGTGRLSDEAINNISRRTQRSRGIDLQWSNTSPVAGFDNQLIVGGAYFRGLSTFDSVIELSDLDPITRVTIGLGTGTFVDAEATSVTTATRSTSLYFTNTTQLTDSLALTLSARANDTDVRLQDISGVRPELNGEHRFLRVNPAAGLTWQASADTLLYASYSESSRAPTPIELACNEGVFEVAQRFALERGDDPDDIDFECRLPNAFLADPPLEQVVAKNIELGARGTLVLPLAALGALQYEVGLFNTTNRDDILFQTTGRSTGLFANVDKTRRRGFEGKVLGSAGALSWMIAYSHIKATFEADFNALSPNHDFADGEGEIAISKGDSIPGIPEQQFKLVADYALTPRWQLGLDMLANSGQTLRGDESNQLAPTAGYAILNLRTRYAYSDRFEVYARVDNLLDRDYETFGLLGEEPGEVDVPLISEMTIPRFLGAGQPRAAFVGLRVRF